MKIEKLEVSNNKFKYIAIGFILCAVIFILINYLTSRASYRNTQSIDLAKGTITYKVPDLNVIAMFIDGEPTDTMPGKGYEIDRENSYCYTTNPQVHEEDITLLLNSSGNLEIGNLKKGSKCYLYFIEKKTAEQMIAKLEEAKGGDKYTIDTSIVNGSFGKAQTISTNKLYKYPEGDDYTYIFRGNVTDNWLRFANKTWRIIRINSDGTLRVIFQCNTDNCTDTTGTTTNALSNIAYKKEPYNYNTYVGYYYGTELSDNYNQTHSNATPSTIADEVTKWYNSNLSEYTNKISGSTGFCNDRRVVMMSDYTGNGTGQRLTAYAPYSRYYDGSNDRKSVTPDLNCNKNDLYTLNTDAGEGNGALEVPAALITADEVALAGMLYGSNNSNNWLYTNQYYWTMSPANGSNTAIMLFVHYNGFLSSDRVDSTSAGVRPVINLKANVTITGKGTSTEPFVVS